MKGSSLKDIGQLLLLALLPVLFFQSRLFLMACACPFIYALLHFGRPRGWLTILLSAFFVSFMTSTQLALLFIAVGPLIALIYYEIAKQKPTITRLIVKSTFFIVGTYAVILFIFSQGAPYTHLHTSLSDNLRSIPTYVESNEEVVKNLEKSSPNQVALWRTQIETIATNADEISTVFLRDHLLGYLIGLMIFLLWAFTLIQSNLGYSTHSSDLTKWKVPEQFTWAFIACFAFNQFNVPIISPIAKNLYLILQVVYFLHGISIAAYFFKHRKVPALPRNMIYAFMVVIPLTGIALGFFDLWLGFRNRIEKSLKGSVLDQKNIKGGTS